MLKKPGNWKAAILARPAGLRGKERVNRPRLLFPHHFVPTGTLAGRSSVDNYWAWGEVAQVSTDPRRRIVLGPEKYRGPRRAGRGARNERPLPPGAPRLFHSSWIEVTKQDDAEWNPWKENSGFHSGHSRVESAPVCNYIPANWRPRPEQRECVPRN